MIPALVAPDGTLRPGLGKIEEALAFLRKHPA
jgi:hypothetical protein